MAYKRVESVLMGATRSSENEKDKFSGIKDSRLM